MSTTINCTKCGNPIEITEAIRKELEEKVLRETQSKHQEEIEKLKLEKENLTEEKNREIENVKREISETARREAIDKVRKEYDSKIESTKDEIEEKDKHNKELQEEIKNLLQNLRETKGAKEKLEIEYQKKLMEEEDRIKQEAKEEAKEELNLKIAEKDKKLSDAEKQIAELQRKIQQGSQQLQGEVQELKIEEILKTEFPVDQIKEVPKGIKGADIIQIVCNSSGTVCGTIVWESKNTKGWTAGWVQKLKEDQRLLKAELAVIVSKSLPENIKNFGADNGVWISDMGSVIGLAAALRQQLIMVHSVSIANQDKASKAEVVYNYLISNEFRQRIEVWIEYFKNRREELDREKAYYLKKWEKEEKNITKVINNTAGIYGDLQGMVGNALPKIQYLELPEAEEEKEVNLFSYNKE